MCPGGNTSDNTSENTADENIDNSTDDAAYDIANITGHNYSANNGSDSGNNINCDTAGNTPNATSVETHSDTWNVGGNDKGGYTEEESCYIAGSSTGCGTGSWFGSCSGHETGGGDTTNSTITASLG